MDTRGQPSSSSRILIVEDELIVAADLEASLQGLGFQVVGTAGNATEAVAAASHARPDLILMDIQLHGKASGIEVAETVHRDWDIPVVFLTAYPNEDTMQRARAAGAYGFLSKPFRVEDLNATILIALQQHRLSKEIFAEHSWLATMLASLSDGVIAADATGCVRYLNPAAQTITHWTSADALGRQIEEVYPLTHLDGSGVPQCQLRRALAERRAIPKERFLMHVKGDHQIAVEDAASPIVEDGRLLGAVTIFLDVTARMEEEAEQLREQGRLRKEVQTTSAALGQTKEELRALSGRLINAQEDERRRVARELHDDLGQRAALMSWRAAEVERLFQEMPEALRQRVNQLQEDLNQLAAGLREVSHQLHPATIADLGLATALHALVEQQRAQDVEVSLITREVLPDIPIDTAIALYRIAQEALRNAVQHSEGAPVLISLMSNGGVLQLSVEDPGPGFDLKQVRGLGGLGLLSMQERAHLLGGTLTIETAPDQGTSIVVRLPLASA